MSAGSLMEMERPASRRSASTELVVVDPRCCPVCGSATKLEVAETVALFRHAGHGGTRRVTCRYCRCGWALIIEVTEVRPER